MPVTFFIVAVFVFSFVSMVLNANPERNEVAVINAGRYIFFMGV